MTRKRKPKPPTIGEQIRAVRRERGISQASVAEVLGVSQGRVSDYELNERLPTIMQLAAIARMLGAKFCTDGKTTVFEIEP